MVGIFAPELVEKAKELQISNINSLSKAQNYGVCMLTKFILPLQIVAVLLLAAMIGVIVIAKPHATKKVKSDML